MAFDTLLKSNLNNGDSRYLKRTVGHALNQCISDVIQVRPVDPVEYMGLWLRRYVDSRNYFKWKQTYYENLVRTKENMSNRKKSVRENFNQAVRRLTDILENKGDESSHGSDVTAKKMSRVPTPEEPAIQILEDVAIKNPQELNVTVKAVNEVSPTQPDYERSERFDDSNVSSNGELKLPTTNIRKNFKESAIKVMKNRTAVKSNIGRASPMKFRAVVNNLVTVNHPYILERSDSVETFSSKWKIQDKRLVCSHPLLGFISFQSEVHKIENYWVGKGFAAESFYDGELYTYTADTFDDFKEIDYEEESQHEQDDDKLGVAHSVDNFVVKLYD